MQIERAGTTGASERTVGVCLALMLASLLIPAFIADIPILTDYPNHLARLWFLCCGIGTPPVSSMYRASWDTYTNIGIDVVGVMLSKIMNYRLVGQMLIVVASILIPLGSIALWRALYGRVHPWLFLVGLLVYNFAFLAGFLNFEIGLGAALLAASADPLLQRSGRRATFVGRVCLGAVLLLIHFFAIIFYAALLAGIAYGNRFKPLLDRREIGRLTVALVSIAAALLVPILIFGLLTPSLPGRQVGANFSSISLDIYNNLVFTVQHPVSKLGRMFAAVFSYVLWLDVVTLIVIVAVPALSLLLGLLRVHAGMLLVSAALLFFYLVFPRELAGTYWVDSRFALMLPLTLVIALRPDLPSRFGFLTAGIFLALFAARTGLVGWIWHERQSDVAAVWRALEPVPPGVAILPVEHQSKSGPLGRFTSTGESTFRHMVTLALPWRHAFVPTLFAARGKQPVEVLPPWKDISMPEGGLLMSVAALSRPELFTSDKEKDAPYFPFWRDRFDYVLVLNADQPDENGPFVPPPSLQLVKDEGFARLYRIVRAGSLFQ